MPAPVIVITPLIVTLSDLVDTKTLIFTITNYGLIKAIDAQISFESSYYIFEYPNGQYIGDLPPNSTILQTVIVSRPNFK